MRVDLEAILYVDEWARVSVNVAGLVVLLPGQLVVAAVVLGVDRPSDVLRK